MKPAEQARRRVDPSVAPELREIIEGIRDSALSASGHTGDSWEKLTIDWRNDRAKAVVSNLGGDCIALTLDAETHSSNGVHSVFAFEVSVDGDGSGEAYESWRSDWSQPAPGSNSGNREGDAVITQLESEVSRFIGPITADSVLVAIS